jgi:hypothetical protein
MGKLQTKKFYNIGFRMGGTGGGKQTNLIQLGKLITAVKSLITQPSETNGCGRCKWSFPENESPEKKVSGVAFKAILTIILRYWARYRVEMFTFCSEILVFKAPRSKNYLTMIVICSLKYLFKAFL